MRRAPPIISKDVDKLSGTRKWSRLIEKRVGGGRGFLINYSVTSLPKMKENSSTPRHNII